MDPYRVSADATDPSFFAPKCAKCNVFCARCLKIIDLPSLSASFRLNRLLHWKGARRLPDGINDFVGKERKNILHCMSTDGRLFHSVKGF